MPDLTECPRLLIRNVEYERHCGQWFYRDALKRKCLVLGQTNGTPLAAALDEIMKLCEEHPRHGGRRVGWEENHEQAKRIRELEAELQSAKEMNERTAKLEQRVVEWREKAERARGQWWELVRAAGFDCGTVDHEEVCKKLSGLEKQLVDQKGTEASLRQRIADLERSAAWENEEWKKLRKSVERFPATRAGATWVDAAVELLDLFLACGGGRKPDPINGQASVQIAEIPAPVAAEMHPHMRDGLEAAGYTIVDGTGDRGTAPPEASPREIAERAAADRLDRECLFDARQRRAVAAVIAAGVEAYHQAQQEDGGG